MRTLEEQLRLLLDGAEASLPEGELERKLARVAAGERGPLRVKLGVDPTSPDIHVGHAVVLRKLRDFQRLGHTAVLIIGGFTAQVGDPSGRSQMRPALTPEEVEANAETYLRQVGRVLLDEPLEVVDNRDWLEPMSMADVLRLAKHQTVAQLLAREDFARRFDADQPIAMSELLYPLLQGYDSVAVRADVELGGTDQTFNLLVGRDLQRIAGHEQQATLTLPLLEGTDGREKMSKSLGNHIGLDHPPEEKFGRAMSVPDSALERYLRLATDVEPDEVDVLVAGVESGEVNPGEVKRRMARELVALYDGAEAAERAEQAFDRQFREGRVPEEVPEVDLGEHDRWFLPTLLRHAGLATSGAEARRLVEQGAVRLDGDRLEEATAELDRADLDGRVLQVGKRRFARLRA